MRLQAFRTEERGFGNHASWAELFFDLVFVAVVANLTHYLAHHPTWEAFLTVAVLFWPGFWCWIAHMAYHNSFHMDDAGGRLYSLTMMAFAVVYAVGVRAGLDGNATLVVVGYIGMRAVVWAMWERGHTDTRAERTLQSRVMDALGVLELSIFAASAFVPSPWQQVMWVGAIGIAMFGSSVLYRFSKQRVGHYDVEHILERNGLFVIIVLGESIVAIVANLGDHVLDTSALIAGGSGFIIVAAMWWRYFGFVDYAAVSPFDMRPARTHTWNHFLILVGLFTMAAGIIEAVAGHNKTATYALAAGGVMLFQTTIHVLGTVYSHGRMPMRRHLGYMWTMMVLGAIINWGETLGLDLAMALIAGTFTIYVFWVHQEDAPVRAALTEGPGHGHSEATEAG